MTTPKLFLEKVITIAGTQSNVRPVSGAMVALAGIFNPLAREFHEMIYLKQERPILDGTKFRTKFGRVPTTPYKVGIEKTLEWFRAN